MGPDSPGSAVPRLDAAFETQELVFPAGANLSTQCPLTKNSLGLASIAPIRFFELSLAMGRGRVPPHWCTLHLHGPPKRKTAS